MRITWRSLSIVGMVLALGASSPRVVVGQEEQPGQEQPQPGRDQAPPAPDESQAVTGLEVEGELQSVDMDQRFFLIDKEDGTQAQIYYDDQTEVSGAADSTEGLAGQQGTWLRVQYRAEGSRAIAEHIDMMESAPERSDEPSADQPSTDEPSADEPDAQPGY